MDNKKVFITEPGNVPPRYLKQLREVGILVVVAKDPNACRFIDPQSELPSGDLLKAAMKAIQDSVFDNPRIHFANLVADLIADKEVEK